MLWLLCFFFQAEDGIRDLYVTGVQTCALPIYVHPFLTFRQLGRDALPDALNRFLRRSANEAAWNGFEQAEIGRASCRERVEIPVVAVSLKITHEDAMTVAATQNYTHG